MPIFMNVNIKHKKEVKNKNDEDFQVCWTEWVQLPKINVLLLNHSIIHNNALFINVYYSKNMF